MLWSGYFVLALISALAVITLLTAVQLVNLVVESRNSGTVQMTGGVGHFMTNPSERWSLLQPKGLPRDIPLYDHYNIPPLPEYMELMPSSRMAMACCTDRHKDSVTCFGGLGIMRNTEVQMNHADQIVTNNATLYKYGVLNDYWTWNNLNKSWKRLNNTNLVGTYHAGCWTDQRDQIWFGGGLVREGGQVVVQERSFHTYNSTNITLYKMPRLAKFAYWTDHRGQYMYLFGGHDDLFRYSNEVWRVQQGTQNWTRFAPNNGSPLIEPRIHAVAYQHHNTLYIFGGESRINDCFADLWMFVDKRWTKLYDHSSERLLPNHKTLPQHPGCRKQATVLAVDGMNQVKVRGGLTAGNLSMTDTWLYSVSRAKWMWLEGSHAPNIIPFQHPITSEITYLPSFYNAAHWTDHLGKEYYFGGCSERCTVLHSWVWSR